MTGALTLIATLAALALIACWLDRVERARVEHRRDCPVCGEGERR